MNDDLSDVVAVLCKIVWLIEVVCELYMVCDVYEWEKVSVLELFVWDIVLMWYEVLNVIYREVSVCEWVEDDVRGALARSAVADAMWLCVNEEWREVMVVMKLWLRFVVKEFWMWDENCEV